MMMYAIDEAVGRMMREKRVARGLSLEDVAGQTGQTKSNVCHLESGRTRWSVFRLVEIARVLGVSPSALLSRACAEGGPRVRRRSNPAGS